MAVNEAVDDREIVVSRVIAASRATLFAAWTEVRHLARWFGPHGFTTTTRSFEFRPGGVWDFDMHGPDGTTYANHIEWGEIMPPERIVYVQGARADDPDAFAGTVTFRDVAGGTEIVLRTRFNTKEQRDMVVERYGAVEGAVQTLGRLSAYVTEATAAER